MFTTSLLPPPGLRPGFPRQVVISTLLVLSLLTSLAQAADWKAGVAKADITPEQPMWMSGYASRDHRAEGTLTKLWGKVLILEDAKGQRIVAVTLDLVGIDQTTSNSLRERLVKE